MMAGVCALFSPTFLSYILRETQCLKKLVVVTRDELSAGTRIYMPCSILELVCLRVIKFTAKALNGNSNSKFIIFTIEEHA